MLQGDGNEYGKKETKRRQNYGPVSKNWTTFSKRKRFLWVIRDD